MLQILGGDLAGIIEEADASSKVAGNGLLNAATHANANVWKVSRGA